MQYGLFCETHRAGSYGYNKPRERGEMLLYDDPDGKVHRFKIPYAKGKARDIKDWIYCDLYDYEKIRITGSWPVYHVEYPR